MDLLSLLSELQEDENIVKNHPAKDLSSKEKMIYLTGLSFIMGVDNDIHQSEKEYLTMLINTFNLPKKELDQLITAAENPTEPLFETVLKTVLKTDLVKPFLVDTLMLSHSDQVVKKSETALFDIYRDLLKISPDQGAAFKKLIATVKIEHQEKRATALKGFKTQNTIDMKHFSYLFDYLGISV